MDLVTRRMESSCDDVFFNMYNEGLFPKGQRQY